MSRRIRVLELRSVRGTGGGPEKTIMLGAAQANVGRVEVLVCYLRDRRDGLFQLADRAAALGIRYLEIEEHGSFDVKTWAALRRVITDHQIDIVHAHEYKTDVLAWALSRNTTVVPLATTHGWTGVLFRERQIYYPLDKWVLSKFPRVIAVSSEIKQDLVRRGADPGRITVILNAIDPSSFRRVDGRREAMRRALGLAPDAVVIGAVGRIERQKRFDLLLETLSTLVPEWPHLQLVVVGEGALRDDLAALAQRLGLTGRCHLLGHRTDIADLHHAFDLFVQSSEYEGTPNAVLEAMAMETPLVATDVGGTRELVSPDVHGLIVPKHDTRALARAIDRILRDPASARGRAIQARARVENELSFGARTRRLEGIYEELFSTREEPGARRGSREPKEPSTHNA